MKNAPRSAPQRRHRKLEELNLLDNFLFQEMLSDEEIGEEFARILLSTILERPIRKVRIIPQKAISGIDTDRHGIRLDAYIEEIPEEQNILKDKRRMPKLPPTSMISSQT